MANGFIRSPLFTHARQSALGQSQCNGWLALARKPSDLWHARVNRREGFDCAYDLRQRLGVSLIERSRA